MSWKNITLSLLSFALALFVCEFSLVLLKYPRQTFGRLYVPDRLYHHSHIPHSTYREIPPPGDTYSEQLITFNDDGFRDLPPRDHVPKILFLGDSFVEARQVSATQMFGNIIEGNYPQIDIVHIACSSWSSPIYYGWFRRHKNALKDVRAVYLFYFANDPYDTLQYVRDSDNPEGEDVLSFNNYYRDHSTTLQKAKWFLQDNLRTYAMVRIGIRQISHNLRDNGHPQIENGLEWLSLFQGITTPEQKEAVRIDFKYVKKINALLRSHNVPLYLVYVPLSLQVEETDSAVYPISLKGLIQASTILQDRLRLLSKTEQFNFIDLTPALITYHQAHPEIGLYNKVDDHFSVEGHKTVASILSDSIEGMAETN